MKPPVALVTGGARRIGAAIVRALHAEGFAIALHHHHSAEEARALAEELNAVRAASVHCLAAELRGQESARELVQQCARALGGLDALVNNASRFRPDPPEGPDEASWQELADIHLRAPLFLCYQAAPLLRQRGGCIINLLDVLPHSTLCHYSAYSAAKGGLAVLTRALAARLAPEVRVNGVAPGAILLPAGAEEDAGLREKIIAGVPLGRLGTVEEIAAAVCFLARSGSYITGQVLPVDGGRSLAGGS